MCGNVDRTANMHCAVAATERKQRAVNQSWSVIPANTKGFYHAMWMEFCCGWNFAMDGILQLKYIRKPHGWIPPLSHFIWAIFPVKKDLTKIFNARTKFLNNCDEIIKKKIWRTLRINERAKNQKIFLKKDRPNFKPISKIEKEILLTF